MLRQLLKRVDTLFVAWLRRPPVWPKALLFLLSPWPLAILLYKLTGGLYDDGHIDWWHAFQYPITIAWMIPLYWWLYKQGRWPKKR
jgi:hypothetical protein